MTKTQSSIVTDVSAIFVDNTILRTPVLGVLQYSQIENQGICYEKKIILKHSRLFFASQRRV